MVASILALLFLRYRWVQYALYPYAVVLQTLPVIAIAPFGGLARLRHWRVHRNLRHRMLLPLLTSLHLGLSIAPRDLTDLFKLLDASPRDTLLKLRLPYAVPMLFSGLRTALACR